MAGHIKITGPNPIRGCLVVEGRTAENRFLFVFRRRGSDGLSAFDNSGLGRRCCSSASFAPPKNKKENGWTAPRFYKQATPNGVEAASIWWTGGCAKMNSQ